MLPLDGRLDSPSLALPAALPARRAQLLVRRVASDLDVDIASGAGDREYLRALEDALGQALERTRPDFAFYLAGADPWSGDRLGRLALSKAGLAGRDALALDRLLKTGAAVCVVLAGGYAEDVRDTVDINAGTAAAVAAHAFHS